MNLVLASLALSGSFPNFPKPLNTPLWNGRLVQQPPPPRPHREYPACRSRGALITPCWTTPPWPH